MDRCTAPLNRFITIIVTITATITYINMASGLSNHGSNRSFEPFSNGELFAISGSCLAVAAIALAAVLTTIFDWKR
ncbi:hypothetical protein [Phaffia rhodozyma]|uniref:Uncharacterized protein n=1 Tax=Phaffia rhodozyma TaxID=264483 RepID=A0A0F7SLT5_PHARH|nr:hypothetical protein [Phaffia rhodozyma]